MSGQDAARPRDIAHFGPWPNPKRPAHQRARSKVTIAGGMVCGDGVLVLADTEWTATTLKIQRAKHWRIIGDNLRCVAAVSGDEDFCKLALQYFGVLLRGVTDPLSVTHVHDALRNAVTAVYQQNIYPDPRGTEREFGIIMGAMTATDAPVLFKTAGPAVITSDTYEFIYLGAGAEMATYLTSKVFRTEMPLDIAEYLASYVLWEVKQHSQYCGGDSVIYALGNDGSYRYLNYGEIRDREGYFDEFDRRIQKVRLNAANLSLSDQEFETVLQDFVDDAQIIRKARKAKYAVEDELDQRVKQQESDRKQTKDRVSKKRDR